MGTDPQLSVNGWMNENSLTVTVQWKLPAHTLDTEYSPTHVLCLILWPNGPNRKKCLAHALPGYLFCIFKANRHLVFFL